MSKPGQLLFEAVVLSVELSECQLMLMERFFQRTQFGCCLSQLRKMLLGSMTLRGISLALFLQPVPASQGVGIGQGVM